MSVIAGGELPDFTHTESASARISMVFNLEGLRTVTTNSREIVMEPGSKAMCATGATLGMSEGREGCVVVSWRSDYLRGVFSGREDVIHPQMWKWIERCPGEQVFEPPGKMSLLERRIVAELRAPDVHPAAQGIFLEGKVLELMSHLFFQPSRKSKQEMDYESYTRVAGERAARVAAILKQRMVEPPSLGEIAAEVGCSTFYLSRTFSKVTGKTIPQYLREIRIQRAAELLAEGRHNVTEAAFEVGYSSLGHFSTAFCRITGCCPSLYPQSRHLARDGF